MSEKPLSPTALRAISDRRRAEALSKQADIYKETQASTPAMGGFLARHPNLSAALGGISSGALGTLRTPIDVVSELVRGYFQPGREMQEYAGGLDLLKGQYEDVLPFVPQIKTAFLEPSTEEEKYRAGGELAGSVGTIAALSLPFRGGPSPIRESTAEVTPFKPPVRPPVRGLLPPRTIDVVPERPALPPKGPIVTPGVSPKLLPSKIEGPLVTPPPTVTPEAVGVAPPESAPPVEVLPPINPAEKADLEASVGRKLTDSEAYSIIKQRTIEGAAAEKVGELPRPLGKSLSLEEQRARRTADRAEAFRLATEDIRNKVPLEPEIIPPGRTEEIPPSELVTTKTATSIEPAKATPQESPLSIFSDDDIKSMAKMGDPSAMRELEIRGQSPTKADPEAMRLYRNALEKIKSRKPLSASIRNAMALAQTLGERAGLTLDKVLKDIQDTKVPHQLDYESSFPEFRKSQRILAESKSRVEGKRLQDEVDLEKGKIVSQAAPSEFSGLDDIKLANKLTTLERSAPGIWGRRALISDKVSNMESLPTHVQMAIEWVDKHYPRLFNLVNRVIYDPELTSGGAEYNTSGNYIILGLGTGREGGVLNVVESLVHELEHAREYREFSRRNNLNPRESSTAWEWLKGYYDWTTTKRMLTYGPHEVHEQHSTLSKIYEEQPIERGPVQAAKTAVRRFLEKLAEDERGFISFKKDDAIGEDEFVKLMQTKIARGDKLSKEEQAAVDDITKARGYNPVEYMRDPKATPNVLKSLYGMLKGTFGSANLYLDDNPYTKPISDAITAAQDAGDIWEGYHNKAADKIIRFSSGRDMEQVWDLLDNYEVPLDARGKYPQDIINKASALRALLDNIHNQLEGAEVTTKSGDPLGFINKYVTHLMQQSSVVDDIRAVIDDMFRPFIKKTKGPEGFKVGKEVGEDVYSRATGTPESPFVERRKGAKFEFEKDLRTLMRVYNHGARKVLFDKPAVLEARDILSRLPEGFNKDLATWYVRNYARFESEAHLTGFLKALDRKIAYTGARQVLFGNSRLQLLHLMRFFSQVYPELGEINTAYALIKFIMNPVDVMRQARQFGLTQQSIVPFRMKQGALRKLDALGNFLDVGNNIAKGLAFQGFLRKNSGNTFNAISDTKKWEGVVDPARPIRALEIPFARTFAQFKYWMFKYLEQGGRITSDMLTAPSMENLLRFSRYIGVALSMYYLSKKLGITLYHFGLRSLEFGGGVMLSTLRDIRKDVTSDNYEEAAKKAVFFFVPGSKSIPRELTKPSILSEPSVRPPQPLKPLGPLQSP